MILPGTKSTRGDLALFRSQGWDIDLRAHVRRGGHVLGICGGFQMLGQIIADPDGLEGPAGQDQGLGLLNVETHMQVDKALTRVRATHNDTGADIDGYEIHIGRSAGADCIRPFARINGAPDGATSKDGRIVGTYLHGLFSNDRFRAAWLAQFGLTAATYAYGQTVEDTLDALAAHMETHLDVGALLDAAAPVGTL